MKVALLITGSGPLVIVTRRGFRPQSWKSLLEETPPGMVARQRLARAARQAGRPRSIVADTSGPRGTA